MRLTPIKPYIFFFISVLLIPYTFYGQKNDSLELKIAALSDSSEYHHKQHNLNKAIAFGNEALEMAKRSGNQMFEIMPTTKLAQAYFDKGDMIRTQQYFDRLEQLTSIYNYPAFALKALEGKASIKTVQGKHIEALMLYEQAVKLAKKNESDQLPHIMVNMSSTQLHLEMNEEALQNLSNGAKHYKEIGDSSKLAIVYNNIGELYRQKMEEFDLARKHYLMAIRINSTIGNKYDLSKNYNNMGALLSSDKINELDSAIFYLEKSLNLKKEMNELGGQAIASYNLGTCYLKKEDAATARKYLEQTLTISKKLDIPPGIYYANIGLAQAKSLEGDDAGSLKSLLIANDMADKLDDIDMKIEVLELLYEHYSRQNTFSQANLYLEELNQVLDSLISAPNINQSNYGEVKAIYEKELTEADNEILKARQKESEALLKAHRKETTMLIISAIALILITILMWIGYQQRNRSLIKEKKITDKLEEQNKILADQESKLQELNDLKNRIFSILGHDLRAPLNTISSFIELLQMGDLPEEDYKTILAQLKSETHLTLKTLENILAWARLQMNEKTEFIDDIDLPFLVDEVIQLFQPVAANKDVQLSFNIEKGVSIKGNQHQVRSVISNLVSNAIKFTPSGKTVDLTLESTEQKLIFRVVDEGTGIESDKLEQLALGGITKSSYGTAGENGTGIGLSLVKEFVEKHNGQLIFTNNSPTGTIAEVQFPLSSQAAE